MRNNQRATKPLPLGGGQAREKEERKFAPFPGVIDHNRWTVKEGGWPAFIDRSDLEGEGGVMHVPLEGTDEARKLRLHEQAHVAWTPNVDVSRMEDVSAETIGACEDARIIKLMGQKQEGWKEVNEQVDCLPPPILMRHMGNFEKLSRKMKGELSEEQAKGVMPLIQAGRLLAMSRGYYESRHFDEMADNVGLYWVKDAVNAMHDRFIQKKKNPTFEDSVEYARELERYLNEMEEALGEQWADLEEAEMEIPRTPEIAPQEGKWGRMVIEEAPLTQRLEGADGRKIRPVEMGAIPRYMHRVTMDQRVFGRRRKIERYFQGTVLIDHSGSMDLTAEEVDEILHRWPAVTIATYSGHNSGHGTLRVVAKKGKRCTNTYLGPPGGGDNMVDGPALDWLAAQRGPRVWVSDGGVTGIGGRTPNLITDAAKKMRKGQIKRIDNVQELLRR